MSIPILDVTPQTQNQRVPGFEVANEDAPLVYRLTATSSVTDIDEIIWAAYRQVFSEHLILESYRQTALESQLRNRAITVQEFVRGLGKSEVYRSQVADTNSNYRLVDLTFKRFLGRASYGQDEQISWSIVIATQGLHGFIDAVVDSEEYLQNFGQSIVPYQRRRMEGRPFNLVNPRYNDYWRNQQLSILIGGSAYSTGRKYQAGDRDRQVIRRGIPANFMSMAEGMLLPERNYQRASAQASHLVNSLTIPDMTRDSDRPQIAVRRTEAALPYRYIPSVPKA